MALKKSELIVLLADRDRVIRLYQEQARVQTVEIERLSQYGANRDPEDLARLEHARARIEHAARCSNDALCVTLLDSLTLLLESDPIEPDALADFADLAESLAHSST